MDEAVTNQQAAPQMSRESRAMLLNVLWHHQGYWSDVGRPLRAMLGIEQGAHLTDEQVGEAKWIDGLLAAGAQAQHPHPSTQPSAPRAEAVEALQAIEHALRMGFSPAEVLDENSPIRDGIRAAIAQGAEGERNE